MTTTKRALPRPTLKQVQIKQLHTHEAAFQPRSTGLLENHVARLLDALQRGDALDRLAVWEDPETGELIVADGHHRLEAYRRANVTGKIGVEIFKCDRTTAMLIPIKDNAKSRVSMPEDDKRNWAWRMTKEGGWSKAATVSACGVGDGTVGRMRRIMKKLKKRDIELPEGWKAAQAAERGDDNGEWTHEESEEWRNGLIDKADRQFGASLAYLCKTSPEAAGELLALCAGGRLPLVLDGLGYMKVDEDGKPLACDERDFEVDECDTVDEGDELDDGRPF